MADYTSFSRFYDRLTENVEYTKLANYLSEILAHKGISEGILLDLACGTGSLSVEMAKAGYDVIGIDASADMLCEAQNKMYENGLNILFLCQPMQELDLYGTIDAAICTLDSINHVVDSNLVKETFQRVSLFMNKGGIFIFDVNTPYKHKEILGNNTFVYDLDDIYCVWQNQFIEKTCSVEISLDFFERDGNIYRRYEEQFAERAYSNEELTLWLNQAGFEVVDQFGDMTKNPPNDRTQRLFYIARKER